MPSLPFPGDFVLFDVIYPEDEEAFNEFNRRASKIKECFALYGPFNEGNYIKWEMKEGKVYVSADESGCLIVSDFFPKENLTSSDRAML